MEVSSISKQIQNTNGSLTYQIGTRNASTVLRLKDGETQILAGLINKEDRRSANSVPILGEIPILGRLFSTHSDSSSKTEVVLLITPRVIRNIVKPESPIEEFSSGTEGVISLDRLEIQRAETNKDNLLAEVNLSPATLPDVMPKLDLPAVAASLGNVKLALDVSPQVKANQPFPVKINLVAEGLQSAMLDMSFDPAKLRVVGIEEGDLMKGSDGKTRFLQQVQEKSGRINLSVIRQGNIRASGVLATINFQSITNAPSSVELRIGAASFLDSANRVLPVNTLPLTSVGILP
jgi:general secretion pathway protein D